MATESWFNIFLSFHTENDGPAYVRNPEAHDGPSFPLHYWISNGEDYELAKIEESLNEALRHIKLAKERKGKRA